MSDREEWGEWWLHDGLGIKPFGIGLFVEIEYGRPSGRVMGSFSELSKTPAGRALGWHVDDYHQQNCFVVIRYRIRKPSALIQLREMIETLPAPSRKEDA